MISLYKLPRRKMTISNSGMTSLTQTKVTSKARAVAQVLDLESVLPRPPPYLRGHWLGRHPRSHARSRMHIHRGEWAFLNPLTKAALPKLQFQQARVRRLVSHVVIAITMIREDGSIVYQQIVNLIARPICFLGNVWSVA